MSFNMSNAPIISVIVFADRAEVTRLLPLRFGTAGHADIVLEGLPASLETETIRVDYRGSGLTILEVSESAGSFELDALDNEWLAMQERRAELLVLLEDAELNRSRVERSMKLVDSYAEAQLSGRRTESSSRGQNRVSENGNDFTQASCTSPGFAGEVLDFHADRLARLHAELSLANKWLRVLQREDKELAERQRRHKSASRHFGRTVTVSALLELGLPNTCPNVGDKAMTSNVAAACEGKGELHFRYVVKAAGWSPAYDIHVSSKDYSIMLLYYGAVWQSSGEDWDKVALSLSTGKPALGLRPPRVPQRFAGFSRHTKSRQGAPRAAHANRRVDPDDEDDGEDPDLSEETAYTSTSGARASQRQSSRGSTVRTSAVSSTFDFSLPSTIASTGKPHRVMVAQLPLQANITHYATPSVGQHAYLRATMQNTGAYVLIPSNSVRVSFDGAFVSSAELSDPVGLNATFMAFLGADPTVRVHATPEQQQHRMNLGVLEGRLFDGFTDVGTYSRNFTIENTKAVPLYIVIKDSLPISKEADVKVEVTSPAKLEKLEADVEDPRSMLPGELKAFHNDATGEVIWGACIGSRSDLVVTFVFDITAPSSKSKQLVVYSEGELPTIPSRSRISAAMEL